MGLNDEGDEIVSMSPAHFRTLVESAGLTQGDVAAHAGKTQRMVRYWLATHKAPLEVQEWVRECWREVRDTARALVELHAEDDEVMLTMNPTGWGHDEDWTPGMDAAVTRLALALLEIGGTPVTVA